MYGKGNPNRSTGVHVGERANVVGRDYVDLVRVLRERRHERGKPRTLVDDPRPVSLLVVPEVTDQARTVFVHVLPARVELGLDLERDARVGVYLPVRMQHSDAARRAPVLEDEDEIDAIDLSQLAVTSLPVVDELRDMLEGKLRKGGIVLR